MCSSKYVQEVIDYLNNEFVQKSDLDSNSIGVKMALWALETLNMANIYCLPANASIVSSEDLKMALDNDQILEAYEGDFETISNFLAYSFDLSSAGKKMPCVVALRKVKNRFVCITFIKLDEMGWVAIEGVYFNLDLKCLEFKIEVHRQSKFQIEANKEGVPVEKMESYAFLDKLGKITLLAIASHKFYQNLSLGRVELKDGCYHFC